MYQVAAITGQGQRGKHSQANARRGRNPASGSMFNRTKDKTIMRTFFYEFMKNFSYGIRETASRVSDLNLKKTEDALTATILPVLFPVAVIAQTRNAYRMRRTNYGLYCTVVLK